LKKIATILLLIFTLIQVAPAFSAFFSPSTAFFMVDEEKGGDIKESDKKENKKDYTGYNYKLAGFSHQATLAFHQAEIIYPSPCIDKVSPPPNFC